MNSPGKFFRIIFIHLALFGVAFSHAQEWQKLSTQDHVNFYDVQKLAIEHFDQVGRGKGSGYKLYQRWAYFAQRHMDDDGIVPTESDVLDAKRDFDNKLAKTKNQSRAFSGDWKELGPFSWTVTSSWSPGVGRITALAVEETNQQLLFAGAPGGGIWRTTDGAQYWEPIGDNMTNMNIFGLGIDPYDNNNVYALNGAGRIIKSTNQGDSWTEIFNTGAGVSRFHSIIFHPNTEGTMLVAASNGVWKSTDNGGNFTRVMTSYVEDIAYKPGDPSIVYACGDQFFKSTNGAESFTSQNIGNGQRLRMAVTPGNPNYVYLVQRSGGAFGGLYRSANSGESFLQRAASNPPYFTQADRDMAIMVSSTDPEEVHVAGMDHHRSSDGGNTFIRLAPWSRPAEPAYIHADVEIMMCINDVFYAGSDGGVYRSTNHGINYEDLSRLGGLAVHQFYTIAGSKNDPDIMIGGSQDNGINIMKNKSKDWITWVGADGNEAFVDYDDPNIIYGAVNGRSTYKSTDGGNSYSGLTAPGSGNSFIAPFMIDPIDHNTIYFGADNLYRSINAGSSFSSISSSVNSGTIDQMDVAPSDNNYIYIANNSRVWVTSNGQAATPTWTERSGFSGNVNSVIVDPDDPQRVAIACSGSRVYVTTNAGATWVNTTLNLPATGANCVAFDAESNNGLYVGTENAVYYTNDNQTGWLPFSSGLPKVRVTDMEINQAAKLLRVGTYGRGLWESGLYGSSLSPTITSLGDFIFCEGGEVTLEATLENPVGPYSYQWKKDGVIIHGANSIDYVASASGEYSVVVSDLNASGESYGFDVTEILNPLTHVQITPSCGAGEVGLHALNADAEISWYSTESALEPEFTGGNYNPILSTNTTLFVEASTIVLRGNVGPTDNSFGDGGDHGGGYFLIFDLAKPMELMKAKVYASGAKYRTLELRNQNDVLVESKEVFIPDGESVLELNLNIPAGNDYKIGFLSGANLYRNSSNTSYPYDIEGLVNIKASTAAEPTDYYYYLYDWEVEEIAPKCTGDRIAVVANVIDKPIAPATTDYEGCAEAGGPYVVSATTSSDGELRWFESPSSTTVLQEGEALEVATAELGETPYYVEELLKEDVVTFGAPVDNSFGSGSFHGGGQYLIVDVNEVFTLKSAKVYSETEKERTLEIRDSNDVLLQSKNIIIPIGESRVAIDLEIPVQSALKIGFPTETDLFRNNEGVEYPYDLADVATISNSSAGEEYYYYLYDWEISTKSFECASERAVATITIDVCTGVLAGDLAFAMSFYPNPTQDGIHIEKKMDLSIVNVNITNLNGQKVYENNELPEYISLGHLPSGDYVLSLIDVNGGPATYAIHIVK